MREFERSGVVSPAAQEAAGFGEWSRLTPAWILFAALKLEVLARQDAGEAAEGIAGRLGGSLTGDAATRLVRAVMGDMREVRVPAEQSAVTLQNVVAMLSAAWADDGIGDGGSAAEWAGPAGLEVRALQPVLGGGSPQAMNVRFVGCDGPGWLLRGTVTGQGAEPESFESWPYEVFRETVVNAEFAHDATTDFIPLRWPPER